VYYTYETEFAKGVFHTHLITNFNDSLKMAITLKNWKCMEDSFSQIQSHNRAGLCPCRFSAYKAGTHLLLKPAWRYTIEKLYWVRFFQIITEKPIMCLIFWISMQYIFFYIQPVKREPQNMLVNLPIILSGNSCFIMYYSQPKIYWNYYKTLIDQSV